MADSPTVSMTESRWYALRDLKRSNSRQRAWEMLRDKNVKVFTPTKWVLVTVKGERHPKEVAFIPDLLFAYETRRVLDPIIAATETLQFRFRKYGRQHEPIVVPDADMQRFIHAVHCSDTPRYYLPEEVTPGMYGRKIRIVGGPLDGYEGGLLTTRGSRVKRLLVELQGFLSVGVEVNPEYIQLIR